MTIIWTEEEGEMWRCGGGGDLGVGDRELTETMLVPKRGNSPFVDGSSPFMNGIPIYEWVPEYERSFFCRPIHRRYRIVLCPNIEHARSYMGIHF